MSGVPRNRAGLVQEVRHPGCAAHDKSEAVDRSGGASCRGRPFLEPRRDLFLHAAGGRTDMTNGPVEIVLIEDNSEHAELTVRALKRHNVTNHIRVLTDGAEAVDVLLPADGSSPPPARLILLDLKLPKLDGVEVLRRIKGDQRTRAIPVVVLT